MRGCLALQHNEQGSSPPCQLSPAPSLSPSGTWLYCCGREVRPNGYSTCLGCPQGRCHIPGGKGEVFSRDKHALISHFHFNFYCDCIQYIVCIISQNHSDYWDFLLLCPQICSYPCYCRDYYIFIIRKFPYLCNKAVSYTCTFQTTQVLYGIVKTDLHY